MAVLRQGFEISELFECHILHQENLSHQSEDSTSTDCFALLANSQPAIRESPVTALAATPFAAKIGGHNGRSKRG